MDNNFLPVLSQFQVYLSHVNMLGHICFFTMLGHICFFTRFARGMKCRRLAFTCALAFTANFCIVDSNFAHRDVDPSGLLW